ncbi:DUF4382 domain-containing protein [Sulfuricaulis sp.]|jgi:hypothetical protein|uniref:DUF4382 domain-containing protein n=1 Tax=Sulfuricaulis sp. TaxID=2003553 RepID=UPI003559DA27
MNTPSILKRCGSILVFGTMLAIAGCGGSGGGSGGASTGTLSLQITDGPVDTAEHVYVQFSGLEIQSADGKRTTLYYCQDPADATKTVLKDTACTTPPAPKQLDLLALSGGQADLLLDDFTLPSGHYSWVRLMVDTDGAHDSYIVLLGGAEHELTIPSGDQTGLKLNRGFDVPDGGSADFTIDFDLRKSVHVTGTGEYMLRPTLRMVDNVMVGSISGTVSASLVPGGCTPAVYVFAGSGVAPDDIDGIAPDPVTTASVKLDSNDGLYKYKAAFLEAGSYTIAYTCDAAADDPIVDDALTFSGTTTVTVTANTSTVHNF